MTKAIHYLATPYSSYGQGKEQACVDARSVAARLMRGGLFIFSPIAYGHGIEAEEGCMSESEWLAFDMAMLDECDSLIVVMMPGWNESAGITKEIARAAETNKPITYLSWPMLNVREDESGGYLPASG